MDLTTSLNSNQVANAQNANAKEKPVETAGTIADNSQASLFSQSTETAGTIASNSSSTSSSSGGSISYNA